MKWFKHFSDAHHDEFLEAIIEEYGLEGYARWWLILEAIAAQMDKSNRCSVTYSWVKWQSILKGKRKKLEPFLLFCVEHGKLELPGYQFVSETNQEQTRNVSGTFQERSRNESGTKRKQTENKLEMKCAKLLSLRDNFTGKREVVDQVTTSATSKQEVEVEVEVEVYSKGDSNESPPAIKKDVIKKKSTKGKRLSTDWQLPLEWGQWALDQGKTETQIRLEADKFKDYWISTAGAKGVKLDWFATWRNWNRSDFNGGGSSAKNNDLLNNNTDW